MFCLSTGQSDQPFLRQQLLRCGGGAVRLVPLIVLLLCVATSGVVWAELPQRSRTLTYQKLTHEQPTPVVQTQNNPQNRTLGYEPVTPQRHIVSRPAPEPQGRSSASQSSGDRTSSRTPEELLDTSLPEPGGRITDRDIQAVLDDITRKSLAAKTGETTTPTDNTQGTSVTDTTGNALPTSGIIIVERIVNIDDDWFAFKEGSKTPIPVLKSGDRFFAIDGNYEVMRPDVSAMTDDEAIEGTKSSLADDKTRNAMMLIVTTISVLAAFGIGILAFDYKHRWEQEIVSQNSRLLGSTTLHGAATHGTFTELDSLEPDTLRFSLHNYGSLDDSFDHSFRTIA